MKGGWRRLSFSRKKEIKGKAFDNFQEKTRSIQTQIRGIIHTILRQVILSTSLWQTNRVICHYIPSSNFELY